MAAANEPQQALKDRVAAEARDYERGRDIYARRKFHDYEKATQGEKKIMRAVGQPEKRVAIPRAGEWVVQAPLKVKAGKKWNKSGSSALSSMRASLDGSGASNGNDNSRPFPGAGTTRVSADDSTIMQQMNGSADADILASDFRSQSISDISRLQSENVLQRRAASALPAPVPLSMPGERELTATMLRPEEVRAAVAA